MAERPSITWPDGKQFALAIVDDTDQSVLSRIKPIYDTLLENGISPTKTVWPLRAKGEGITGGDCLEDEAYAEWVNTLPASGVEIALHGAADESSTRERVLAGFDRFQHVLGQDPRMHINHTSQAEALYWGADRVDRPLRWLYGAFWRYKHGEGSQGHVPGSSHFWGDICRDRIRYVRNFTWKDINTLKADPLMPYHDPSRPFVKYWFSGTNASGEKSFCKLLSEANLDRLAEEGGACFIYTHLGTFDEGGGEFKRLMRRLGSLPGWFVSASTLLDYIGQQRGYADTSSRRLQFQRMQWRWFAERVKRRR